MRPDVALIGPYPPAGQRHAGRSGVASYHANLAHALADRGLRPVVIASSVDGEPVVSADGPVRVERRYDNGPNALVTAARAAVSSGAPMAHLQMEMFLYGGPLALPGLAPALAYLRARRAGPVVTLHQVMDPSGIDRDAVTLHRVSAPPRVARAGLSALQHTVGRLAAATVVHEKPFTAFVPGSRLIPHGVEQVAPAPSSAVRDELGLDGRLRVLCFGFLSPYKGLETALEAVGPISDRVDLIVAGGEHPRLAGRDSYAADLCARWGGTARFTGWVPDRDVERWFRACDLALFPYPKPFSSSGALALALAYRTPVLMSAPLATCVGAPDDLVVSSDPTALGDRLLEIAADRDELKAMAAWTDAVAEDRSWAAVSARHAHLYEEVTHARRTRRRTR